MRSEQISALCLPTFPPQIHCYTPNLLLINFQSKLHTLSRHSTKLCISGGMCSLFFTKSFLRSLTLFFIHFYFDRSGRRDRFERRTSTALLIFIERRRIPFIVRFGFTSSVLLAITLGASWRFFLYGSAHFPLFPCYTPPPLPP